MLTPICLLPLFHLTPPTAFGDPAIPNSEPKAPFVGKSRGVRNFQLKKWKLLMQWKLFLIKRLTGLRWKEVSHLVFRWNKTFMYPLTQFRVLAGFSDNWKIIVYWIEKAAMNQQSRKRKENPRVEFSSLIKHSLGIVVSKLLANKFLVCNLLNCLQTLCKEGSIRLFSLSSVYSQCRRCNIHCFLSNPISDLRISSNREYCILGKKLFLWILFI